MFEERKSYQAALMNAGMRERTVRRAPRSCRCTVPLGAPLKLAVGAAAALAVVVGAAVAGLLRRLAGALGMALQFDAAHFKAKRATGCPAAVDLGLPFDPHK